MGERKSRRGFHKPFLVNNRHGNGGNQIWKNSSPITFSQNIVKI